jgi:hypothetical protein
LISASTWVAAVPSWSAGELADADGWALDPTVAVGCGDAGRDGDADGDGPVLAGCAVTVARCDGTVATAGGAATATSAALVAQGPVAAVPHPAAVVREFTTVGPDAGLAKKAPWAK